MEYSFVLFVIIELCPGSSGQFEHVTTRTECSSQQIHICWSPILSGSRAISSHLKPSQATPSPSDISNSCSSASFLLALRRLHHFRSCWLRKQKPQSSYRSLPLAPFTQTLSNLLSLQPPVTNNIAAWGELVRPLRSPREPVPTRANRTMHWGKRAADKSTDLAESWLNPGRSLVEVWLRARSRLPLDLPTLRGVRRREPRQDLSQAASQPRFKPITLP